MSESPDLDFLYEDADRYQCEIAELYSYTEEPEFLQNKKCLEESLEGHSKTWGRGGGS